MEDGKVCGGTMKKTGPDIIKLCHNNIAIITSCPTVCSDREAVIVALIGGTERVIHRVASIAFPVSEVD